MAPPWRHQIPLPFRSKPERAHRSCGGTTILAVIPRGCRSQSTPRAAADSVLEADALFAGPALAAGGALRRTSRIGRLFCDTLWRHLDGRSADASGRGFGAAAEVR